MNESKLVAMTKLFKENNTRYKYNKIKKEKGEEQNERRFGNNN